MTFEEKSNRLAEIVSILEKGEVDLDESTKLFQESIELAKDLNNTLKTQKGKIVELKKVVDEFVEEEIE
jgi:exodeoxyribonuclease VII small subunit